MIQIIPRVRHQLGAEELLELGRGSNHGIPGRQPFLAARHELGRQSMGDLTTDTQAYVTGSLAAELETLASLIGVSYDSLLQGGDVTFGGLLVLLDNAPVLMGLLSQILLFGNTAMRYGLPMPVSLANGLSGVLQNVGRAMSAKAGGQKDVIEARDAIVSQAPAALRVGLKAMLDSTLVPVS